MKHSSVWLLFLPIFSGLLVGMGFPGPHFPWISAWWIMPLALVPLFFAIEMLPQEGSAFFSVRSAAKSLNKIGTPGWRGLRAFWAIWIFGIVVNAIAFYWTTKPSILFGGIPAAPAYLIFVLYCLLSATFFPIIFLPYIINTMHCARRTQKPLPLISMALVATAAETFVPRFFFWTFGSLTHNSQELNQWSSFFGFSTITFFILWGSSSIARQLHKNLRMPEKSAVPIGMVCLVWLCVWGIGKYRYNKLNTQLNAAAKTKVAWVQPNFTFSELSSAHESASEDQKQNLGNLLTVSQEAVDYARNKVFSGAPPELLIWPESVAPSDFARNPKMLELAKEFAAQNQLAILVQAVQFDEKEIEEKGWNRATAYSVSYLIRKDGSQSEKFIKWIPMPFGETVPFEDIFPSLGDWVRDNIGNTSKVGRGNGFQALAYSPDFRVAPLICFDGIYPKLPRLQTSQGNASLLVNQANFVWMGKSNAGYEFLQLARYRAIENGRSMILAANTGPSLAIDPLGRFITQPTQLFEKSYQAAEVPVANWTTLYNLLGDIPLAVFGALCAAKLFWHLGTRNRINKDFA